MACCHNNIFFVCHVVSGFFALIMFQSCVVLGTGEVGQVSDAEALLPPCAVDERPMPVGAGVSYRLDPIGPPQKKVKLKSNCINNPARFRFFFAANEPRSLRGSRKQESGVTCQWLVEDGWMGARVRGRRRLMSGGMSREWREGLPCLVDLMHPSSLQ